MWQHCQRYPKNAATTTFKYGQPKKYLSENV